MEIRQLRYFLKIADAGSFSRASQVLHIAQPSLSHQILQLEAELGEQLLHRKPSGVEMSDAGRAFYREAQRIVKALDDLPGNVRKIGLEVTGRVSVGLPQSTALRYAMPLLESVGRLHRGITLELFDEPSGHLLMGLDSGRLDVAVMVNDDDWDLLDATLLMNEELFFVAPPAAVLPSAMPVSELCRHRLALPGLHHGVRALVEGAVRAGGGELPAPAIEANSIGIMLRAVETGLAASIQPWGAVADRLDAGTVQAVPLTPRLWRKVRVCTARDAAPSKAVTEVRRLLLDLVREQVVAGRWRGVELL